MAGLGPMRRQTFPFRVGQNRGYVLGVGDFLRFTEPNLGQRIEGATSAVGGGRVKLHHLVPSLLSPPGGERPVLALDVVAEDAPAPRQQRRQNQSYALPRARRRERQHVLRAVVNQVAGPPFFRVVPAADIDAVAVFVSTPLALISGCVAQCAVPCSPSCQRRFLMARAEIYPTRPNRNTLPDTNRPTSGCRYPLERNRTQLTALMTVITASTAAIASARRLPGDSMLITGSFFLCLLFLRLTLPLCGPCASCLVFIPAHRSGENLFRNPVPPLRPRLEPAVPVRRRMFVTDSPPRLGGLLGQRRVLLLALGAQG